MYVLKQLFMLVDGLSQSFLQSFPGVLQLGAISEGETIHDATELRITIKVTHGNAPENSPSAPDEMP